MYSLPGIYTKADHGFMYLAYMWFALLSLPQLFNCLTTQRCAGIRTTDIACAHASGALGGSDVRMHR